MDIVQYNSWAWDTQVEGGNRWTIPVSPADIENARKGVYQMLLTPKKPVPKEWIGEAGGKDVLCLACGGGQQGPVFSALGANVTVFDNSQRQLMQDETVAKREGLFLRTQKGDMRDLSVFANESFDLIFHPVSNCFVEEIAPVWKECFRVLRPGGVLLSGFVNPLVYLFDPVLFDEGNFQVKNTIPYSDLKQLPPAMQERFRENGDPFEFGHSLTQQISGQLEAGFLLAGFYEDRGGSPLDDYIDSFIATKAVKM